MSEQAVGPYRILEKVGAGGMGEVYLAEDARLGRKVALKRPSRELLEAAGARERLHREARAAAALNHPNIAAVYDVLEANDRPYIVMEYVEGRTLSDVLQDGPLPVDRAVDIALQLAEAVAEAHAHGIVHRDLKPGNVRVTPAGRVKVLDFGLAKVRAAAADPDVTIEEQRYGTPGYAAPEQLVGQPGDARSDIYSFGAVLFELLAGRPPFDAADGLGRALQALSAAPPPVETINPEVPRELSALVARAPWQRREAACG